MSRPVSFVDSLKEAELGCFAMLCEKLRLVPGQDAFISVRGENAPDCIVFDIGHLQDGQCMAFPANQLYFRASAEIYNRDRDEVQRSIMRMVEAFPVGTHMDPSNPLRIDTNVLEFRIAAERGAIGGIEAKDIQLKKDGASIPAFVCSVQFDVVFLTGER